MAYFGAQGLYRPAGKTTYRHRDGTINNESPGRLLGWHDECAHEVFGVDRSQDGWGCWHHDKGMSWAPWLVGVDCEVCGKPC